MAKLGYDEAKLKALGAFWTASEIEQQPAMLRETSEVLIAQKGSLEQFLQPLVNRAETRVILTGAGTSAFIGECLAPYLPTKLPCRVEAIPTTDLVSAPKLHLHTKAPILLVSFARSGNSPESVAAVDLADQFGGEVAHLAITCNGDGELARKIEASPNGMTILLPEQTHDRSFAMTSSFSCMMYAGLAALTDIDSMQARIEQIASTVAAVIGTQVGPMKSLAGKGCERVVYLGGHIFKGLAREAALKLLELTDGKMIAVYDSPMGFRHGPKTIVNDKTLVVVFLSNDIYARRYDLDLLEELVRDDTAAGILVVCARGEDLAAGVERVLVPAMEGADDVDLLFPFIVAPQIFAFEESIGHGLSPDKPNTSGTVNRVVQGVRIHAAR